MALDTPTGMQPHDNNGLVFQRAHPHIEELNNPTEYGNRPAYSYDPQAHYQWRVDRAEANDATGNPIVPGAEVEQALIGADV